MPASETTPKVPVVPTKKKWRLTVVDAPEPGTHDPVKVMRAPFDACDVNGFTFQRFTEPLVWSDRLKKYERGYQPGTVHSMTDRDVAELRAAVGRSFIRWTNRACMMGQVFTPTVRVPMDPETDEALEPYVTIQPA